MYLLYYRIDINIIIKLHNMDKTNDVVKKYFVQLFKNKESFSTGSNLPPNTLLSYV